MQQFSLFAQAENKPQILFPPQIQIADTVPVIFPSEDSIKDFSFSPKAEVDTVFIRDTIHELTQDTFREIKTDTFFVLENKAKKDTTTAVNQEKAKDQKEISPLKSIGEILSFTKLFWILIILLVTYYFLKLVKIILRRWSERKNNNFKKSIPFIQLIVWITSFFIIEQAIIQLPSETLFAILASTGIAIGIAAQDVLKNIFGGIVIIFDRPFQIGDKIKVGEYYGEVKEIGLRSTRIVTPDDSMVSLPNAEVVNKSVSNSNYGENHCQVVTDIYLPTDIDTNLVRKIAKETAQTSRYIYLNKPITVLFLHEVKERKPFLKMRLKAYVSNLQDEFLFQSDLTEVFLKELTKKGIIQENKKS